MTTSVNARLAKQLRQGACGLLLAVSCTGLPVTAALAEGGEDPPCPDAQLQCAVNYYTTFQKTSDFGCRIYRPDSVAKCTHFVAEPADGYLLDCDPYDGAGYNCRSWPEGPEIGHSWQISGHLSLASAPGASQVYIACSGLPGRGGTVAARTHLPNGIQHTEQVTLNCQHSAEY